MSTRWHTTAVKFRHASCGLLALFLIVSGRVRRARRQAFGGSVLTSIYFHEPNTRLFTKCISWLVKHGYTFISADELIQILRNGGTLPRGAVWISLDDGYRSWLHTVLPVIRRHKVPVTLFIPSGIVAGHGLFPWRHDPVYPRETDQFINIEPSANVVREALTLDELKEIATWPEIRIGGHTASHAVTVHCSAESLRREIGEDKRAIETWTSTTVNSFAYPGGVYDSRARQFLQEAGIAVAATTEPSFVRRSTDPLLVPRFCVPDNVTFPEAVCSMVGVWRPISDPIKRFLRIERGIIPQLSSGNGGSHQS